MLAGVDGVLIPGGFGVRGIEGKLEALRYARERQIPTLGICLGLQCMVIEAARNLAGLDGREQPRVRPGHAAPRRLDDGRPARRRRRRAGHGRHDAARPLPVQARSPGRVSAETYGATTISERHRHRYEVANAYRDRLTAAGLVFSGTSPDGRLVEMVELPRDVHPYYVGTQAHPEFKSRPTRAHPLFRGLVAAAVARSEEVLLDLVST